MSEQRSAAGELRADRTDPARRRFPLGPCHAEATCPAERSKATTAGRGR